MKKTLQVFLFLVCVCTSLYSQSEKQVIIDMLAAEAKAWAEADYETWQNSWVHSPTTQMSFTQPGSNKIMEGWEEIHHFFKGYFERGVARNMTAKMEDIKIEIGADLAFVSFTEVESYNFGLNTTRKKSMRVVKKTPAGWKILASNVLFESELQK